MRDARTGKSASLQVPSKDHYFNRTSNIGPVVFEMRFPLVLVHSLRGKGGTINTTQTSKII